MNIDINGLLDFVDVPVLPDFGLPKISVVIVLLLVIIFWGNKTLKDVMRIVAVLVLLAVLFGFINV